MWCAAVGEGVRSGGVADWFAPDSVAGAMLALSVVIAGGLALGSLRVRGISLGVAGVLFAGLAAGHFGLQVSAPVLHFVREFGLILFVFTIGLHVGPGFFASLRRQGLRLNLLAAGVVLLGVALTVALVLTGQLPVPEAVGMFAGAVTNTPSLAAAGEALAQVPSLDPAARSVAGMAYAVAYPFGILGTILAMLLVRAAFRVDLEREKAALETARRAEAPPLATLALEVENPNLEGQPIARIPGLRETGAIVSRLYRDGAATVAKPETTLRRGDVLLVVGRADELETLRLAIGRPSAVDVRAAGGPLQSRRVIVTHRGALGRTLAELALLARHGVTATRVARGDQEFTPGPGLRLQFSDTLTLVGEEAGLAAAERELGNSFKRLNTPMLVPIFVGIGLGVLLGAVPLAVPGLPAPVRLGLAGGPLLVALILSRVGHFGPLVWYMPLNANYMLREIGIALFLACVGLASGEQFVETLLGGAGVKWLLWGAVVTFVPIATVALVARAWWKLNFVSLCGLLAGSMTDPPALAFANGVVGSEAPALSYVTVYPLTMILRVFAVQAMVLLLAV